MSGSSGCRGGGQSRVGQGELDLVGMSRGHGELDAADRSADLGADLEEREAQRAAGGLGELGNLPSLLAVSAALRGRQTRAAWLSSGRRC